MTKADADRIAAVLGTEFRAHVEVEETSAGRYRFELFSRHFGPATHLERHDQGWAAIDRLLTRDQVQDVAALLMYGPEDVDAELAAAMPA
jgi:hypothetical protein